MVPCLTSLLANSNETLQKLQVYLLYLLYQPTVLQFLLETVAGSEVPIFDLLNSTPYR